MNEKTDEGQKVKFLLTLTSYSQSRRISECVEKLESLYPYAIDRNDLLIKKTNEKNKYEVYVEGGKEQKRRNVSKIIIMSILGLVLIGGAGFVYSKVMNKRKEDIQKQKEIESVNQEKIRIHMENEKVLKSLKEEYEKYLKERYEKIYPRFGYIYSCVADGSVIENLLIDKNHFSIDIKAKDSMKILSSFEKSRMFQSVRMIRASSNEKYETVTISGDFSSKNEDLLVFEDIKKQIEIYQKELANVAEKRKMNEERSLSSYMNYIKRLLEKSGCTLEYIQVKGEKENAEIECFIHSSSHQILEFVQKIQNEENGDYDIKQFSLRNGNDDRGVQTKVLFDCHRSITDKELRSDLLENDVLLDVTELEKIFIKKSNETVKNNTTPIKPVDEHKIESKPVEEKRINAEQLSYIGLTKRNGVTVILAKGGINESMYKFILTEEENNEEYCVDSGNKYYAFQNGTYYEVIK